MNLRDKRPALILIDFQKGFDKEEYWGGNRNNKNAESNAQHILQQWRNAKLPVFHVRHSSQNPVSLLYKSNPGFEIKDEVKPIDGEMLITKNVNSAFIDTNLKAELDAQNIQCVVIIGLTTNHCVSTTTRMAGNYGYETIVIADATAAFDRTGILAEKYSAEIIHLTSLASLKDEFAEVMNTEQLLENL
jgi:nicotinamidase-related amidase